MGFKSKFLAAKSWLGSHKPGSRKYREHIITTHVEDVSVDYTETSPKEDKHGSDDKLLGDAALTKILDANDKVQVAMKRWYELEQKMNTEWAKNESCQSESNPDQQEQSTTIMDAISHQLRTVQRWQGGGGDSTGGEQVDSMSSDTTHSFSLPVAPSTVNGASNLWVDFSDSSGSQLSRQSPALSAGFGSSTPGWKTQTSFNTPREGWAAAPRRSSGKGRLMGATSPDLSGYLSRPHSTVSGTIVPHFNLSSPFSAAAGVYGTPRLVQTETVSRKPEFKHSASLPRNFAAKSGTEQNDSEYESCESKELSGTSTWQSAKSSLRERLSSFSDGAESDGEEKYSARKLSSCPEKFDGQKSMSTNASNMREILDASMPSRGLENRSTVPFAAQKSAPASIIANGLERHAWHSEELVCSPPVSAKKRTPPRRLPPALRVRFTPEHLKDVLGRVGECPPLSSMGIHSKMPVTRL